MDPFLGEIRVTAFNFAPVGWAMCNGQILPISQNTALFAVIGTFYGGNGTSNFQLPNFQDLAPLFFGQGPGLSQYSLGETAGSWTDTLLINQMPIHTHPPVGVTDSGTHSTPTGSDTWAEVKVGRAAEPLYAPTPTVNMSPAVLTPTGGGLPFSHRPPTLSLNFIIALQGVFPTRP